MKKLSIIVFVLLIILTAVPKAIFGQEKALSEINKYFNEKKAEGKNITAYDLCKNSSPSETKDAGDITFGSETQINSGGRASYLSMVALTSSTFIVAYYDYTEATGSRGVALIGTISGTGSSASISYSGKFIFEATNVYAVSISALDNSTFVIAYRLYGGSAKAIIGSVTGGSISFASSSEFCSDVGKYAHSISVSSLDASHFIIAYQNSGNSNYGEAIIGTIGSGNSITFNTATVFNSANTSYIWCDSFNSNSFVIVYRDQGYYGYGTALSGKVTYAESNPENTTIAFGSEKAFENSSTYYCSVSTFNSTSFIVAYYSGSGKAIIGNVSYDTNPNGIITFGSSSVFNNANTSYININILNGNRFVVVYRDEGNSKYGTAITGEISGSSITGYGSESVFYNSDELYNDYIGLAAMPTSSGDVQFATACKDNTNKEGHSYVGTVEGVTVPVELSSFTANLIDNNVVLNWQTATEVNNFGFEIQRSVSSVQRSEFETIGFVDGAGNSNSPKEYSFEDNPQSSEKYFYRLKQIDLNGSYEYSNIVEVNLASPSKFKLMQNYPNPFNPTTTITYVIARSEATRLRLGRTDELLVQLKIYDALGREVATLVNEKQTPGNYAVKFDASKLTSGIYFYTLRADNYVNTKKMILMK